MKGNEVKKIDVRVQKTYEKLYKTFFELLASKPYESITVLEICGETGVHRATFYKHFVDKQDFVNFCVNKKLDELELNKDESSILRADTKEFYITMCEKIIIFISDNKRIFTDLNAKSSSTTFAEALESAIAAYIEKRLTAIAASGRPIGSPVHLLACYHAGAIVALFRAWAYEWETYTKEDIMDFITARFNELDFSYNYNRMKNS